MHSLYPTSNFPIIGACVRLQTSIVHNPNSTVIRQLTIEERELLGVRLQYAKKCCGNCYQSSVFCLGMKRNVIAVTSVISVVGGRLWQR